MTKANELTASEAQAAIRAGDLKSRQLIDDCLDQAQQRDDDVGAWIYLNPEMARAAADEADRIISAGEAIGPLHGIPVGLKDIIDTKDMPTEQGSDLFKGRRPVTDSTMTRLLRDAGAIIMGKTVTTEYALTAAGKTRNPHNPDHTPGGSSSGSAAAVADQQIPLSIGSQTGGSMIRPASFCGVHGFKPTFGTISRAGMHPLARPLDHPGIYARSLEDIALMGDVLMSKDPLDLDMRGHPKANLVEAVSKGAVETPPRIAFVKGPMWEAAEPYMDALFKDIVTKLGSTAREVEMAGIFDDALDCHSTIMLANIVANLGDYIRDTPDKVHKETIRRVAQGNGIVAEDYVKAIEFSDTVDAAVDHMFEHCDVIITPAAPGEAPKHVEGTGNAIFQKLWTLTGVPTLTLPKLQGPNGLPIGIQVIGRFGQDAALFRNAMWIENAL